MPLTLRYPGLLAAGVGLTLAVLLGVHWLPARQVDLLAPGVASNFFLIGNTEQAVKWLDHERWHWRCEYAAGSTGQGCGLTLVFSGDDAALGRDFSRFDSVLLEISHQGSARQVRLAARNFDPRFSRVEDGNSARIHSIHLRPRDIAAPLQLGLDELIVPEWWIQQFDLRREFYRPSLDNVTAVFIDLPDMLDGQPQELQLRRLVLQGEWLHREQIYLAILVAWVLSAVAVLLRRWRELRASHGQQQRKIDALTERTRQLRADQDRLQRLATVDELTGVLNRRGLEQSLADLAQQGRGMTLALLDIDHFKQVNDRWGHERGDAVLRAIAALVVANLRGSDLFGRWGGEEFLIACPGSQLEQAAALADKLRARIAASDLGGLQVSASFGVAVAAAGEPSADALRRADAALYRAKAAGRNRVETEKG